MEIRLNIILRSILLYNSVVSIVGHDADDENDESTTTMDKDQHKNTKPDDHMNHMNDSNEPSRLVVVSLDGFRFEYLKRLKSLKNPSALWSLIDNGVYDRDGMEVSFVSTTFPNHYTMVTGLHQESTGIVASMIYDPDTRVTHNLKKNFQNQSYLYGGESIWKTLTRQNVRSSCYMWVSCPFAGLGASDFEPFDETSNWTRATERVVAWLKSGSRLITVYWTEPDKPAHWVGPESVDVNRTLAELDDNLNYLINELTEKTGYKNLNYIFVSDHGMTTVKGVVVIPANDALFKVIMIGSVFWHINSVAGKFDEAFAYFNAFQNITVYKKNDIPIEWHYKNNKRVGEIFILAKVGYILSKPNATGPHFKGAHGYSPTEPDMHGLFVAHGPAFKKNIAKNFDVKMVDIYLMICEILGVNPAPNNGSKELVVSLLDKNYIKNVKNFASAQNSLFIVAISSTLVVLFVLVFYLMHRASYEKRKRNLHVAHVTSSSTNGNTTTTAVYSRLKQEQSKPLLTTSLEHAVDDSDNESI